MKKTYCIPLLLCLSAKVSAQVPTWTDQISCIIYSHCTPCHNPNSIAPFSLMNYEEAYDLRYSIQAAVVNKQMPPFPANSDYQHYAHDISLSAIEIDHIAAWVNADAPLGDSASELPPPPPGNDFIMEDPDLILRMPDYLVNTTTSESDVHRCFPIPSGITGTRYIAAIQVVPGNNHIVHHAIVSQDDTTIPWELDALDTEPGYPGAGTGSSQSTSLTVYTPGQGQRAYPEGFGRKLNANSTIILQIHYPIGIADTWDSTKVLIRFTPDNNVRKISSGALMNNSSTLTNPPLYIPAGESKTFYSQKFIDDSIAVFGIMAHMHLLGKSFKAFCISPAQDTIRLIDIPDWDFHWQRYYEFSQPVIIPEGSTLYGINTFDNTVNNPHNPFSPPQDIEQGESTTDEMIKLFFNYVHYESGDEAIVIDTASHQPHYLDCSPLWSDIDPVSPDLSFIQLYPNPTENHSVLEFEGEVAGELKLYNLAGQLVLQQRSSGNNIPVPTATLPSGMYVVIFIPDNGPVIYCKLLKN